MYAGNSLSVLNRLIHNTDATPLTYYLDRAHILFSHLIVICVAVHLLVAAAFAHDRVRSLAVSFFTTPTSALNLAVFRVAVLVILLLELSPASTIWFSGLPRELRFAPVGMTWLLPKMPISKSLTTVAVAVLVVVCCMGIIGLFTRISLLLALILSFYVLGITQFYGKVSHDHCLVWFLAILVSSPCGDALSLDAMFASLKRLDKGAPLRPLPSIVYSIPLRFASLLLGVIYFFPGFWKLWTCGLDWAFSDNMKYQMYSKWMEFSGWTPFFRLDQHPTLYKSAGLFTLVFETSFIFLILFPRLRALAALGGVVFHSASLLFMRIFFYDLLIFYVVLFDLAEWLKKLGRWLFPSALTVLYDADCSFWRRTIAVVSVLDILDRVAFASMQDGVVTARRDGIPGSVQQSRPEGLLAVGSGGTWAGLAACRMVAARVPLLWPALPLFYLPRVSVFGRGLCRRTEQPRNSGPSLWTPSEILGSPGTAAGCASVVIVGSLLLIANIYAGERRIANGWPFASYPLFDYIQGDEIESVEIEVVSPTGGLIRSDESALADKFMPQRFRGLLAHLLGERDGQRSADRFKALWNLCAQEEPILQKASSVRVYRVTLDIVPERKYVNPVRRELVFEMTP
ncbi:MAG: hypothetical protein C5B58_01485 [Acidobacteria bacterium]|nr:MAG: hypothetical protein C5B58_01485 [Acidobacteriota bacterium]